MIKFSQILESKAPINFIRFFIDWEDHENSYFQFVNKKSIVKDKREIEKSQDGGKVEYFDFKSTYGKVIFLVIIKDNYRDYYVKAYNDVYESFSNALKLFNENIKISDDGYDVKIFKLKIDENIDKYITDHIYWKDDYLLNCEYIKDSKNEISMKPEYMQNAKIKNIILSSKTIGKFNL